MNQLRIAWQASALTATCEQARDTSRHRAGYLRRRNTSIARVTHSQTYPHCRDVSFTGIVCPEFLCCVILLLLCSGDEGGGRCYQREEGVERAAWRVWRRGAQGAEGDHSGRRPGGTSQVRNCFDWVAFSAVYPWFALCRSDLRPF